MLSKRQLAAIWMKRRGAYSYQQLSLPDALAGMSPKQRERRELHAVARDLRTVDFKTEVEKERAAKKKAAISGEHIAQISGEQIAQEAVTKKEVPKPKTVQKQQKTKPRRADVSEISHEAPAPKLKKEIYVDEEAFARASQKPGYISRFRGRLKKPGRGFFRLPFRQKDPRVAMAQEAQAADKKQMKLAAEQYRDQQRMASLEERKAQNVLRKAANRKLDAVSRAAFADQVLQSGIAQSLILSSSDMETRQKAENEMRKKSGLARKKIYVLYSIMEDIVRTVKDPVTGYKSKAAKPGKSFMRKAGPFSSPKNAGKWIKRKARACKVAAVQYLFGTPEEAQLAIRQ
jgi:hypothetical protein